MIYMNVETVLPLILTVFNITNYQGFKMPKLSHSPHIETTPYLHPKSDHFSPLSVYSCYTLVVMEWFTYTKGKLKEGGSKVKNCTEAIRKMGMAKVKGITISLLTKVVEVSVANIRNLATDVPESSSFVQHNSNLNADQQDLEKVSDFSHDSSLCVAPHQTSDLLLHSGQQVPTVQVEHHTVLVPYPNTDGGDAFRL